MDRPVCAADFQTKRSFQAQHQIRQNGLWVLQNFFITIPLLAVIFYILDLFLPNFWMTLLLLFGINSILAVSLNITNGWANLFSLGHGGIMLVGGYAAAFLTLPVSFKRDLLDLALPAFFANTQTPFLPALLFGGLLGASFGVILALPAMRLKGLYFLLATLGFNFITITIVENLPQITNGPMGLRQFPAYTNIWWVWSIAIFLIYLSFRLRKSYFGRALIVMGQDQDLAEHLGINLLKYKIYAFGLSCFFTAMGGILWIHLILNLYPKVFGIHLVFNVVTMIVIGGLGSITGAIIGAGIITGFVEILAPIEEGFMFFGLFEVPRLLGLTTLMLSAVLITILILRPAGIMGRKELDKSRLLKFLHGFPFVKKHRS